MRLSRILLGLIITTLTLGSLAAVPVGAQDANANSAQGIQISPTLVELNAARGKTYSIKLNVMNVTTSDLLYKASVDDFNSADETGSPHIILDSKLPATASIVTWVSTIPEFTLHSRESITIDAQVMVPADAEPGGHYGVLRFSGTAPEISSTGVGLSASAGTLLLVRVDGAITEKAALEAFYSSKDGKQSSFFENSPITFVTRVKNDGNIHVKPVGSIELHDMFGNLVNTMPVNEDKSNVLPSSIRRFESSYDNAWMVGLYTANLTVGYGTTGQAITNTISFWVIPYKVIIAVLLVLAIIIFLLKRMLTVYNRRVIEKHKNEHKNR